MSKIKWLPETIPPCFKEVPTDKDAKKKFKEKSIAERVFGATVAVLVDAPNLFLNETLLGFNVFAIIYNRSGQPAIHNITVIAVMILAPTHAYVTHHGFQFAKNLSSLLSAGRKFVVIVFIDEKSHKETVSELLVEMSKRSVKVGIEVFCIMPGASLQVKFGIKAAKLGFCAVALVENGAKIKDDPTYLIETTAAVACAYFGTTKTIKAHDKMQNS